MRKSTKLWGLVLLGAVLLPEMASAAATFTQQHWRWRNDDGNETTATWKAAQDGAISGVSRGANIRVRFAIANTSTSQPGSLVPKLEYATSTSGPWTAVSTASDGSTPFEMTTTSGYMDGESTTDQLPGSGSFVAGKVVESPSNTSGSVSYGVSQYSNFEYCFRATAKAIGGTTYFFRLSKNGTAMDTYSTYATLTMQVGGASEAPVIGSGLAANASLAAGLSYSIPASGTDPITYLATGLPPGLILSANQITGTPTTVGTYNVQITATNAYGLDTKPLVITVYANQPPEAGNSTATIVQAGEVLITLPWSDADTLAVADHTFTIVSNPSHGVLESYNQRTGTAASPHKFYYKAAANFTGTDSFTWKCRDAANDSNAATCTVTVTADTSVPVANNGSSTVNGGSKTNVLISVTHSDVGQTLTYTIVSGPSHGVIELPTPGTGNNIIYYTPNKDYVGVDSFTWKVSDGVSNSNIATQSISVEAVAPAPQDQEERVRKNGTTSINANYRFGSGYTKNLIVIKSPAHGTVSVNGDTFLYTPNSGYIGVDSFTWKINYSNALTSATDSNSVTCRLYVKEGINGLAYNQRFERIIGAPSYPATFEHGYSSSSVFSIVTPPSHGTVTISNGQFTYIPSAGFQGLDSFTWKMTDNGVESNVATASFLVRNTNARAGMTVLLVVNDLLLPEITNEVTRLQADMINEGYSVKIKPWFSPDALELWRYLVSEYETPDQFVSGAILIGNLPIARNLSSNEITDFAFMNLHAFGDTGFYKQQIWLSRMNGGWQGLRSIKWGLNANHAYRTGTHRLPNRSYWENGVDAGAVTQEIASNALIAWPTMTVEQMDPMWAQRLGGIYQNPELHSLGSFVGYNGHPNQIRFGIYSSCGPAYVGGPLNDSVFTYGGGNVLSVGSTATSYTTLNVMSGKPENFKWLRDDDIWGRLVIGHISQTVTPAFMDWQRDMFYGDLSISAHMAPPNQVPVVGALIVNNNVGNAPLTVNFSTSGSDPDGSIDRYEWFLNGYNGAAEDPVSTGTTTTISHTYTAAHQYSVEVHAVDNFQARAWTGAEVQVRPTPYRPLRVNCGTRGRLYRPGADYTDSAGKLWLHDQDESPGSWGHPSSEDWNLWNIGFVNQSVEGTTDEILYQTYRRGPSVEYTVPLANGTYTLNLGFADMVGTAAGQRVMDVVAQGVTRVTALDVFAQVGGKKVLTVPLTVEVTNGKLDFAVTKNAANGYGHDDAVYLNTFEIIPHGISDPPTVATPATAGAVSPAGTQVALSALGADDGGEVNLTYTWATIGAVPAPVAFSVNGSNAAKNTTATFTKAGTYTFEVTIRDASLGQPSVTSNVSVTVNQVPRVSLTPPSLSIVPNGTQQFSASWGDQFGETIGSQPTFTWSVSGGGTINATTGLFTAGGTVGGPYTVTATGGDRNGTANVIISQTVTVSATGGTVTESDGYRIHTFTGNGTFSATSGGTVEVLLVAGGGGGGAGGYNKDVDNGGGGGGAGGLIYLNAYTVGAGNIPVTVGAGGVGSAANADATSGGASVFQTLTAFGGGHGASSARAQNAGSGGSGGGGSYNNAVIARGTGTAGQGNNGGTCGGARYAGGGGGGGGGAGAAGANASIQYGDGIAGGIGASHSITGSPVAYAAGGGSGAGAWWVATGGAGGSGIGGSGGGAGVNGSAGPANTGSGGGGGGCAVNTGSRTSGGNGGSGIVIVRYAIPNTPTADANSNGIPDAWEVQYFGGTDNPSGAASLDADGDGMTNLEEYLAGTSPTDPASKLQIAITSASPTGVVLQFPTVTGRTYTVECSDTLAEGSWIILPPGNRPGTGDVLEVTDQAMTAKRFYRLRVSLP